MTNSRLRFWAIKRNFLKKIQRRVSFCINFLKNRQKDPFAKVNIISIKDNRKFMKAVETLFSEKIKSIKIISLIER